MNARKAYQNLVVEMLELLEEEKGWSFTDKNQLAQDLTHEDDKLDFFFCLTEAVETHLETFEDYYNKFNKKKE